MRMLKILCQLGLALGVASCHPVMAQTPEKKIGEIQMGVCVTADHYVGLVYDMAKQGRGNYEIMAYLDSVSDPDDRDYIALLMAKTNVTNVQLAVRKAYSKKEVVVRHRDICIKQIGDDVNRY